VLPKYKQVVKQKHGMKENKIKYHISLHTPSNQEEFGVTANVDSGPMESNRKTNAKWPCNRTQCRALTFEKQTPTAMLRILKFGRIPILGGKVVVGVFKGFVLNVGCTWGWTLHRSPGSDWISKLRNCEVIIINNI
jgi:hypothetical protein